MKANEIGMNEGKFTFDPSAEKAGSEYEWILPGFIDAHCHILPTGLDLQKLHLDDAQSRKDVLDLVAKRLQEHDRSKWLHVVHYDQTKFANKKHLSRFDLDKVSNETPILLRHVNGHASVANTKALEEAGIKESARNPIGGEFVRDESGELTGVLLEKAHEIVSSKMPEPSLPEMVEAILLASNEMNKFGITCATDMMTGRWNLEKELEAYQIAATESSVRYRLYVQWAEVLSKSRGIGAEKLRDLMSEMDEDWCKVCGLKIFADGAIGSATAAIHSQFVTTGGQGQLIYPEEKLAEIIYDIDRAGFTMAVHSIGDRSTDLVLDGFEKTSQPSAQRLEHAMILSDEQIARIKRVDCHTTLQPEFLYRFGHSYQAQLPNDVYPDLIRTKSLNEAGVRLSFNSDRPIVLGDPWIGIHSAQFRPEGFSTSESVSRELGIDLYTKGGADANGDLGKMGELKEGAFADYQLYDEDPLKAKNPKPKKVITSGRG